MKKGVPCLANDITNRKCSSRQKNRIDRHPTGCRCDGMVVDENNDNDNDDDSCCRGLDENATHSKNSHSKQLSGHSIDFVLGDFFSKAPNLRDNVVLFDCFAKHLKKHGHFECAYKDTANARCALSNKGFCEVCYKYWALNMSVVYYILDSGNDFPKKTCVYGERCKDKRARHLAHFSH